MVTQSPDVSSLAEVLDRILDKGIVVDLWARVSLVGIELLTIEARVVVASVDTFLQLRRGDNKDRAGGNSSSCGVNHLYRSGDKTCHPRSNNPFS